MTVVRPGGPGPRPCVRCGRRPRSRETFLCDPCLDDPRANREARKAEAAALRLGQDPRRMVMERYHWAGGWGRS